MLGRDAIVAFLTRKWERERRYRLIKELWAFATVIVSPCLRLRMAHWEQPLSTAATATRTGSSARPA
ncbi:MAG: DUF1348 family protein [Halioglobus sp.]